MGVPAFDVNGQFIVGLDTRKIEEALKFSVSPCPSCGKPLRTPLEKGRLKITCPECGHQFIRE